MIRPKYHYFGLISRKSRQSAICRPTKLKALPKGSFIVTKTGTHPMQTKLELFFKWGITFDAPYEIVVLLSAVRPLAAAYQSVDIAR